MYYTANKNSRKKYFIILLITLVFVSISTTLSYFSLIKSQKEEGTKLYTGKLEINYIDGVYLKNPELTPRNEPSYNSYDNVYRNNFVVTSSGTLNQTISVDMEITQNDFNDDSIKYMIFNSNGEKLAQGSIKKKLGSINLVKNLFLAYNGQAKYTLILWYDNTNVDQISEMGAKLFGKINVYSKQVRY